MSEDSLCLDGNSIAGLLEEIFGAELTATQRRCQSCGALARLGAHRVYRSVGTVVRCPVCSDIAMRITTLPDRHVVLMAGTWEVEVASL